tara:strand:+ start:101 stop:469 length:369 start_codon:yes stop_codon:yes gene_type:complete
MADLNKLRQTKEYQNTKGYEDNEKLNKYYDETWNKQMAEIDRQECPLDPIEEAKILIIDKITKHFDDVLFEMVCQEMGNNYLFQSDNYLTEAGYEQFEDEWFEFYHEHHGDIMYKVMQNITN